MESQTRAQLAQLLVALAAGSNSALEAQLEAILAVHMHHALLLHISADPSVPYSARHLAALHVKNGIDRHWRKTSKSSLAADEKAEIRSFVLTLVSEESAKLLRAYAETIAKIAQMDYPHEWPEVVPTLLAAIESSLDPSSQIAQLSSQNPQDLTALKRVHVTQQHCLYTLHRVTKAMYSVKTLRVKHVMYQMAPQLTQYLCSLFTSNISSFITNFSAAVQSNISDEISIEKLDGLVQIARLSLKILRRLLVNGFPERADMVRVNGSSVGTASGTAVQAPEFYTPFEKVEACVNLISSLTGYLKSLLEIRRILAQTSSFKSIEQATSKICITAGKLYTDLIQSRPVAFVGCRGGLDVVRYYWELVAMGDSSGNLENYSPAGNKNGFVDRVLLQGMIIFRGVVKNSQFSLLPPDRHPHTDDAIKLIASQILTPDFVSSAAQLLVTKYLILTAEELEKWDEDPEGLMTDEEADQWEFSLRMCAQKALMDLASKHRTIVSPLLMSMLQHVSDLSPQSNSSAILLKDAVYAAVGYCAYDLFDFMEFDQWFEQKLLKECTEQTPQTNPLWKIIRRRVPMLVSYWIAVKSEPRMRPLFYRVLLHLASAENEKDLVVRLSAVTTLRVVVDEGLLTDSEIFQPFVETCVKVLVELVVAAEDFETKSNCLQTLKSIIYMMGQKVAPYAGIITQELPRLWDSSFDQIMFRTSILLVLTTLVQALKEQSIMLHPLVLPAIQNTLLGSNTSQQMHFLEDSIDLWTATLKNTPSLTPELVSLYSSLSNLIELGSFEHLKVVLRLVESYFVLDAAAFVQHPDSLPLFSKISECLSELRMDATKHISRTLALVVQTSLQSNSVAALQRLLIEAKLLQTLLTEILQSRTKGIVDHIVADFSTIVLRVAVWDVAFVMNFLQEFGVAVGNGASLLPECLEIWIKVYDAMTYPKQRKTMALAFATLVATGRPEVLAQLQAIMGVLSSVLAEVHGLSVEDARLHWYDSIRSSTHSLSDDDEEAPDRKRRAAFEVQDPVVNAELGAFVKEKLAACEVAVGAERWQMILNATDSDVVNELVKMIM